MSRSTMAPWRSSWLVMAAGRNGRRSTSLRMAAIAPRTEEERDLALTEQLLAHYRAKPERLAAMLNGLAEARVGERVTLEEARAAVTGA